MKKKTKPYIDYKTAGIFARMYDFIIDANNERESIHEELGRMIALLQVVRDRLAPVENPDDQYAHFNRDHFTHPVANLRADAWEAGLTSILFRKLGNKEFRNRFTGWTGEPVLKEEIEDHCADEEST